MSDVGETINLYEIASKTLWERTTETAHLPTAELIALPSTYRTQCDNVLLFRLNARGHRYDELRLLIAAMTEPESGFKNKSPSGRTGNVTLRRTKMIVPRRNASAGRRRVHANAIIIRIIRVSSQRTSQTVRTDAQACNLPTTNSSGSPRNVVIRRVLQLLVVRIRGSYFNRCRSN